MQNLLHYIRQGNGENALVFLHYFGGSLKTWDKVIAYLKDDFTCIAIDLPGFGNSEPLDNVSLDATTNAVEELIDYLSLKDYVLIGHSMGGKIAMNLALKQPAGLQSLLLISPSPPTPEPMDEEKRREMLNAYGNVTALKKIAEGLVTKPLSETQVNRIVEDNLLINHKTWNGWIEEGSQQDISSHLNKLFLPTTIVCGDKDPNFSPQFLKEQFMLLPNVQFVEVSNCGHLLPIEASIEAAAIIRQNVNLA